MDGPEAGCARRRGNHSSVDDANRGSRRSARIDIVYLDIWEREVGTSEDANLINPAIGIETCVRIKREAALRVAEGTAQLPTAPGGHVFLPLALLHRPINQAQIAKVESLRRHFHSPQGSHVISFFPAFLPVHCESVGDRTDDTRMAIHHFSDWS